MMVNDRMVTYLRLVATWLIEKQSEAEAHESEAVQDSIWRELDSAARDHLNDLVQGIFGEWL